MDLLPFEEYVAQLNRKRTPAGVLIRDSESREVREELGLDRPLGRLLVIDHVPAKGLMPEGLAFVFDGGVITDAEVTDLQLSDPEIVSVGLYTVDEAAERVKPELAGRIRAALYAQANGLVALCESGKLTRGGAPDQT